MDDFEERLECLEKAHLAMLAQHLALFNTARFLLPLISAAPDEVHRALLNAYDTTNKWMEDAGSEAAFQADARHWLDRLGKEISAEAEDRFWQFRNPSA